MQGKGPPSPRGLHLAGIGDLHRGNKPCLEGDLQQRRGRECLGSKKDGGEACTASSPVGECAVHGA